MNMVKYRLIDDLTSDVLFEAYGRNMKEVFKNAAEAVFRIMCRIDAVGTGRFLDVQVKADSTEELMINWLQQLIGLVDVKEMFFSRFHITEIDERHLKARIYGEGITPGKGKTVVKAVTYYKYGFWKMPDGYKVRVSLDI